MSDKRKKIILPGGGQDEKLDPELIAKALGAERVKDVGDAEKKDILSLLGWRWLFDKILRRDGN
jgi:hypothetical protein